MPVSHVSSQLPQPQADVSLRTIAVRVADDDGRIVKEATSPPTQARFPNFLRNLGLELERIGLGHGLTVVTANARYFQDTKSPWINLAV